MLTNKPVKTRSMSNSFSEKVFRKASQRVQISSRTAELAVVIPVYNEEGSIGEVLKKWSNELGRLGIDYQIHVYNDGSKDKTKEAISGYTLNNKRIIAHDKKNSGHGPTIIQGYRENSDKEWIFQIDSDDEIQPGFFEELWEKRNDYDFLIGARSTRANVLSRKIISFVSRLIVKLLYGKGVYDVNSPYRLMRVSVFRDYFLSIKPGTFAPNVIVSAIACQKKLRIYEKKVDCSFRQQGEVSIKKFKLLQAAVKSFVQTIYFRIHL